MRIKHHIIYDILFIYYIMYKYKIDIIYYNIDGTTQQRLVKNSLRIRIQKFYGLNFMTMT